MSAKGNQKLSKLLSKEFGKSVYSDEYKIKKTELKHGKQVQIKYRLFVFVYSNQDDNGERHKPQIYYLPNSFINNHNVIINGRNVYDQPNDSDFKRY